MKNNNHKGKRKSYYLKDAHEKKVRVKKKVFKAVMKIDDRQRYLNHLARENHFVSLDYNGETYNPYAIELAIAADALKAEETARQERIAKVQMIIPLLNEEDQMLIDLYYYQGLNQQELSELLGIRQSTVSKHLHKAQLSFLKMWMLFDEID